MYLLLHAMKPKNQYRGRKGARNSRESLSRQKTEGERKEDTQLLSIYSGKCPTKCWLSLKNGSTMFSDNSFKLLGFMFSSKPDVRNQINHIVNPVSSRCFVIRHCYVRRLLSKSEHRVSE